MRVFTTAGPLREGLAGLPRPLGFVPTMGALHEGHLRLVEAARQQCAAVAASVFLNPLQFAAGEDFEAYPRDYERDAERLERQGADILFMPPIDSMYPPGFSTIVDVGDIGGIYEGSARPTHFRGVTTVVAKLLNIVRPDVLYLGQKDAQQTAVLRKLARDLDVPVRVEIVPTVREPDGLAMSSRNVYLTPPQRAAAPSLYCALQAMLVDLRADVHVVRARERASAMLDPLGAWEYLDVVEADTFAPLEYLRPPAFVIGAARFGQTRLLDNILVLRQAQDDSVGLG